MQPEHRVFDRNDASSRILDTVEGLNGIAIIVKIPCHQKGTICLYEGCTTIPYINRGTYAIDTVTIKADSFQQCKITLHILIIFRSASIFRILEITDFCALVVC